MSPKHNILPYLGAYPKIANNCFIAPSANVIGNVTIDEHSSIWFNCVLRGDVAAIKIGKYTNIQDGTVIHVTRGGFDTNIGSYVTVGHRALLHACTIEDYTMIGMGSIVMDKVVIESGGWVAAGALITPGKIVRKNEVWAGTPAKLMRLLTPEEQEYIKISALNYAKHIAEYK